MATRTRKDTTKMAKQEKDALAIRNNNLPAHLQDAKVDDLGFGQEDIVVPRIQLVSSQSQIRSKYTNCESDQFWHTGEELSIGKEFPCVVISFKKSLVLMRPQGDKNNDLPTILAFSNDLIRWDKSGSWEVWPDKDRPQFKCVWEIPESRSVEVSGLAEWGSAVPDVPGGPPAATLSYQYFVMPVDPVEKLGPSIFTISRTSLKYARKLNSRLQRFRSQGVPATGIVFKVRVEVESNKKHTYNVWGFEADRYSSENEYNAAEELKAMADRLSDVPQAEDVFETFMGDEEMPNEVNSPMDTEGEDKVPF